VLFERDGELSRLRWALSDAMDGRGSATLIRGPLGIGRSALLAEIAASAAGMGARVLSADAMPSDLAHPFRVTSRLLRPIGTPADWLSALAFCAESERSGRPLVLLVDDLQWTDDASLRWLRSCAREAHRLRVAIIGTLRDGDAASDRPALRDLAATAELVLRPEPLSTAGAMLRQVLGEEVTTELADACHRASAGIPLLLAELGQDLVARGGPMPPETVAAGLAARAWRLRERLSAAVRAIPLAWECAMATLVLADRAEPALLERLTGGDPLSVGAACAALHQLGVLAPGDPLRFTTDLVRDLVGELMTSAEYERLQLNAALALHEAGFPAEEVAERLVEVPSGAPEWAVEEIRAAAEEAIRHGEPRRAAGYLRSALATAGGADRPRLLADLALAEARFDVSASIRHLGQAVGDLPSKKDKAAVVVGLPLMAFRTAGSSAAAAVVARVVANRGELDRLLALRLLARYSFTRGEDRAVVASVARRLGAVGAEPPLATVAEREVLAVLLYTATVSASTTAAEVAALSRRLLSREPASSRDAYGTATLAVTSLLAAGAPEPALQWLDSALDLAERDRPTAVEKAMLLCQRAVMLGQLGRLGPAGDAAWEARGLAGNRLVEVAEIPVVALAAVAMIVRDRALAAEVLAGCPASGSQATGLHLRVALLLLRGALAAENDSGTALDHFLACGVALQVAGWENPMLFPWRPWAARVQRRLGEVGSALMLIEEECVQARRWGAPEPIGWALRAKASLCGRAEAIPLLEEAVETLRSSGNRLGLAKALLDHGLALRAAGRTGADDRVREAYLLAMWCGSRWLAGRALDAGWSGAERDFATGLTEAERRVAELALDGRTNADIAAEFRVTRRAVEKHLTNCYRKLGIAGRAELSRVFEVRK
jgi:DNA-binding CsgD family transcriptional regulator